MPALPHPFEYAQLRRRTYLAVSWALVFSMGLSILATSGQDSVGRPGFAFSMFLAALCAATAISLRGVTSLPLERRETARPNSATDLYRKVGKVLGTARKSVASIAAIPASPWLRRADPANTYAADTELLRLDEMQLAHLLADIEAIGDPSASPRRLQRFTRGAGQARMTTGDLALRVSADLGPRLSPREVTGVARRGKLDLRSLIKSADLDMLSELVDPLTGWYKPWYLRVRLSDEIKRSRRYRTPTSLIAIKLESVEAGPLNELLTELANEILGPFDLPCAIAEDQLAIMSPRTGRAAAVQIANRICYVLRDMSPSFGVAVAPYDGEAVEVLLRTAARTEPNPAADVIDLETFRSKHKR